MRARETVHKTRKMGGHHYKIVVCGVTFPGAAICGSCNRCGCLFGDVDVAQPGGKVEDGWPMRHQASGEALSGARWPQREG